MPGGIDLNAMFEAMEAAAKRAENTLNGKFGNIYRELRGLSPEEIDNITPDASDQKEYERLMALVQQATQQNLDQAQLATRVRALGDVAMRIAYKVPSLARLI